MAKTWFANWFDTEYYHLLYGNKRSDEEAVLFVQHLDSYFNFTKGLTAWDMSCGKGRHARALEHFGFNVIATDLSKQSILQAASNSPNTIEFSVHDMRQFFRSNYFDLVGNFFTSIGYFKNRYEDERIVKNAYTALKPNGLFVLDFLNAEKLKYLESSTETKTIGSVKFIIRKFVKSKSIHKEIIVTDGAKELHHEEKVNLYSVDELKHLLLKSGFTQMECFGNYKMEAYTTDSDRCIVIGRK
jgi:SAM-dependent methyltransferase